MRFYDGHVAHGWVVPHPWRHRRSNKDVGGFDSPVFGPMCVLGLLMLLCARKAR